MSQLPYQVSGISPHFSEEETEIWSYFPESSSKGLGLNSGFCTQTRGQERKAMWALGRGQGSLWVLGLKVGNDKGREQVPKIYSDLGFGSGTLGDLCLSVSSSLKWQRGQWINQKAPELFPAEEQVASFLNCHLIDGTTGLSRRNTSQVFASCTAVWL